MDCTAIYLKERAIILKLLYTVYMPKIYIFKSSIKVETFKLGILAIYQAAFISWNVLKQDFKAEIKKMLYRVHSHASSSVWLYLGPTVR